MDRYPERGNIYWVNLDPTVGTEVRKTRPALILSNDLSNQYSPRVVVAPITSSIEKIYPFEAKIHMPQGFKKVMLDQIRSIDKIRLKDFIHSVSFEEMTDIEKALKFALALA